MATLANLFFIESSSFLQLMHQSFVAPAPFGPRNSGAFNFSIFKALLKALHCRAKFVVKSSLKAPAPRAEKIKIKNKNWPESFK